MSISVDLRNFLVLTKTRLFELFFIEKKWYTPFLRNFDENFDF